MSRNRKSVVSARRPNFFAALIAAGCVGVLHLSFNPLPAGADPDELSYVPVDLESVVSPDVPMPLDAAALLADASLEAAPLSTSEASNSAESGQPTSTAGTFENHLSLRLNVLMLEDAARFLRSHKAYTVQFHKRERIHGDLQDQQSIQMTVYHEPHSVFMKWLTGDRGRKVLFSDRYEDGRVWVKLGGFKGKLLPTLKLDPMGEDAMAESRHPINDAGLLPMVEMLIEHRKQDLERPSGVRCQFAQEQTINGQECFCVVISFATPEDNEVYRKSIVYLEKEHNLPVMMRNYTWAEDCDDLDPEALDEMTLIEDYAFTNLEMSSEITMDDFDRERRF